MQIGNIAAPQTLRFPFSSESQRRALLSRLSEGQTLEARVLDRTSGGGWAIRLMGHTLAAESRLPLVPGQLVQARVESLGPPLVLSLSGAGSEAASLQRALGDLGLADDGLNRAIVRGMMGRGLPVARDEVQALRDLLLGLGMPLNLDDARELEALVSRALLLRSRGLPVTPDLLASTLSHVPPGALGEVLSNLAELLRRLRVPDRSEARFSALADRVRGLFAEAGELTGESLQRLLAGLGVDTEGRLASWIASGSGGLPEGVDDSLRLALVRLQAQLLGMDAGGADAGALREGVDEALRFLTTVQVSGLPSPESDRFRLQIPLVFDGQFVTADLRVSYREEEGGRRRVDPQNVRVSLGLDLEGLGPVRIALSVANRQAVCRIQAASEEKAAFFQAAAKELKAALEGQGYAVSGVFCEAKVDPEDGGEGPPAVGLDLRV